ncbi:MAG: hypothetical protein JJU36_01545 [Phycisphaeraceae bacterium]|nr:hypothetical protein [Phycisphaeraceae bacterium]
MILPAQPMDRAKIARHVEDALAQQPVTDLHTHCYTPAFGATRYPGAERGGLLLWGIDELVTYHYLVAEVFRIVPDGRDGMSYQKFWRMSRTEQADHIWKHLFVERTPISEACRGVLTTLTRLGLDPNESTLEPYRRWFAQQNIDQYIDKVMELANVDSITMTNPVFDDEERAMWLKDAAIGDDPRFEAVLRIDPLLRNWKEAAGKLAQWGYDVTNEFTQRTIDQTRKFLFDWIDRQKAIYIAMSLPPSFTYPDPHQVDANQFIEKVLMPVCRERNLPWAMMIGSRLGVNPQLGDAGDMVGRASIEAVTNLCCAFPENRFLVTMLSRENQHELCVAARKFGNLMVFGCWWFLNNPVIIEEMTRMRLELLGTSFIPQHSDARILDQLIYKWDHTRRILTRVLTDKYTDLSEAGFRLTPEHIRKDVALLLRENFRNFLAP